VAKRLAAEVFSQKRCCILSSATLTVAGKFDYILGRLGLTLLESVPGSGFRVPGSEGGVQEPEVVYDELPEDEAPSRRHRASQPGPLNSKPGTRGYDTLLLGTPFDFREQCRVLVPAWLPEPGTAEAGRNSFELADMIAGLCRVTRGRTMVLFTSYGALDETDRLLRPALEPDGIAVLAQGQDGSRESLLEELRTRSNVVLLGTSSFWEGVDVRGPALSCLVMARLPFQVHTDPLFQARAELVESRGDSSFMNYSVPEAVLRFRQGFGRLIRSRADRGLAVLADRRLVSKRYGRIFLQSLPCPWRPAASPEQLLSAAEEFFGR
jgi:Rad3-related DNA helicase